MALIPRGVTDCRGCVRSEAWAPSVARRAGARAWRNGEDWTRPWSGSEARPRESRARAATMERRHRRRDGLGSAPRSVTGEGGTTMCPATALERSPVGGTSQRRGDQCPVMGSRSSNGPSAVAADRLVLRLPLDRTAGRPTHSGRPTSAPVSVQAPTAHRSHTIPEADARAVVWSVRSSQPATGAVQRPFDGHVRPIAHRLPSRDKRPVGDAPHRNVLPRLVTLPD